MNIIKSGDSTKSKTGEFHFTCKHCGCEWYANRSDAELKISPLYSKISYAYMNCPNCDRITYDRNNW